MKVTLLDTTTGERRDCSGFCDGMEFSVYWWLEGNGSCDCNRAIAFNMDSEDHRHPINSEGNAVCLGRNRWIIVDVSGDLEDMTREQVMAEVNIGYPEELLRGLRIVTEQSGGLFMSIFADLPGDPELGERLIQAIDDTAGYASVKRYRVPEYRTRSTIIDALLTAYYERDGDLIADDLVELIAADPQLTMSRLLNTPLVFADWIRH